MIINYNDCFWGDSTLEKIEIVYDKVVITVFNDAMQKNIYIDCCDCAGITQLINWDENIIENIFVKDIPNGQHQIIAIINEIYNGASNNYSKCIEGPFFELHIVLINDLSFSVVCKNICMRDK